MSRKEREDIVSRFVPYKVTSATLADEYGVSATYVQTIIANRRKREVGVNADFRN